MRSVHSSGYQTLLARLRRARREAGLTQAQVAEAVGRPQSYVSKSESGERRLDTVELLELARVYGKPLGFFVAEIRGAGGGASLAGEGREDYGRRVAGRRRGSRRSGAKRP